MAYVKKITAEQFVKDVIDFELKPYGVNYEYILKLPKMPKDRENADPNIEYQDGWVSRYKFNTFEEFNAFRQYFYEHWKDFAPKRKWTRDTIYREFEWFNLMYGLATDYDFDEHLYKKKADDIYKRVFGKSSKENK